MSYRPLPDPPPVPDKPAHYRTASGREVGYYEAQYIASYEALYGSVDHGARYEDCSAGAQDDPATHHDPVIPQESYRPLPIPPADGAYRYDADLAYTQPTYDHTYDDPYNFNDIQHNLPPRPLPKPPQYAEPYTEQYPETSPYPDPYQVAYDERNYQAPYPEPDQPYYHDLPQLDIPPGDEYKPTQWEPHHEPRQWSSEVEDLDIVYYDLQI